MLKFLSKHVVAAALLLLTCCAADAATIRVANWNVGNLPNVAADDANLMTAIGYAGATHAIDVMAMAETDTASGPRTAADFAAAYGPAYAQVMTAADGGGDRTGFVYNTDTLQLVGSTTVAGLTHPSLRGLFRPAGTNGAEDFYYYAVHLKSGSTAAIRNARVSQAQALRADADALGAANVIFGGDFNWQGADEVSAGGRRLPHVQRSRRGAGVRPGGAGRCLARQLRL